ncbi:MAG: cupredoxin family copper-binding protein [Candidatus Kerfeldbacteria bacterium]|nr:cupredoxin family copper-binding protein [Candidatus Kerfeldbacteria bacterium]
MMNRLKRRRAALLAFVLGTITLISLQPALANNHSIQSDDDATEIDSDADGYVDCVEKDKYRDDADNDGVDDSEDDTTDDLASTADNDDDGIPDYVEKSEYRHNHDNTGKDDAEDLDDDDDGVADRTEDAGDKKDHDNTGRSDKNDPDDDQDGVADLYEITCGKMMDHDNDDIVDRKDSDDDNDGIDDHEDEDLNDHDNDGIDDKDDTDDEDVVETFVVAMEDFAFSPDEITIHVGDSITFTNNGSTTHNVSEVNFVFNTGPLSPGESATITFINVGSFDYLCAFHPSMTGTVVVTD